MFSSVRNMKVCGGRHTDRTKEMDVWLFSNDEIKSGGGTISEHSEKATVEVAQ